MPLSLALWFCYAGGPISVSQPNFTLIWPLALPWTLVQVASQKMICVGAAVANIFKQCVIKQHSILWNDANAGAQ